MRITFFIGAGVSMSAPSCLPSWWQINHAILDAFAGESNATISDGKHLASLIKKREEEGKIPPEFVAEIITGRLGKSYFDVLQVLEGETSNKAHLWLATLAKANLLTAIITTNFDTLIERAFEILGVPLKVLVDPQDYEKIDLNSIISSNPEDSPCLLLKLHGTATRPDTCIDTLAQRKRGLNPAIVKLTNHLGAQTFWVVLGYSGADLEAEPNYLGIRARADTDAPGFVWLQYQHSKLLPVVANLRELYGEDRGIVEYGVLPDWLDNLSEVLPPEIKPPEIKITAPERIQKIKKESAEKVTNHTNKWAKERGPIWSTILLSDIAIKAGYYDDSRTALSKLVKLENELELSSFALGILYQELGDVAQHFGENKDALTYYEKATDYYKDAEEMNGVFSGLLSVAQIQEKFGNFSEAEENYQKYLKYSRSMNDSSRVVNSLISLGDFYRAIGKFQKATEIYNEALPLATKLGLEIPRGLILLGISLIESELGNFPDSEKNALEASTIFARLGAEGHVSESFRHLAEIYYNRGNIQEGAQYLEQARLKANIVGDKPRKLKADYVQGLFLLNQGQGSNAEEIFRRIAKSAEELGHNDLLIHFWQSLARSLQEQNKLEESYNVLQKALETAEQAGLEVQAAGLRNNLGIILEQAGELNDALEQYQKANEIFKRSGQLKSMAQSQGNIANIYFHLQNFEDAKIYYEKVLGIFTELQDVDGILRIQNNLANIFAQAGQYKQAKDSYLKVVNLADENKEFGIRDSAKMGYAGVFYQEENYSTAIEIYQQVFESSTDRKDYMLAGTAIFYAGHTYLQLENTQKAVNAIKKAISTWEMLEVKPQEIEDAINLLESLKKE